MRGFRILNPTLALLVCLLAGCVGPGPSSPQHLDGPLRVSELGDEGDPRRGASLWALSRGLAYAAAAQPARARVEYERAIQVDASNPYAYVALSRHYLELGDAENALRNLDQAELLLGLDESDASPRQGTDAKINRIQPHLDGLRGGALRALGREAEARPLLERARERAPAVWGDGQLSVEELR